MTENEAWVLYKKRRKKRLDSKEDGRWVTTDNGHKVHINEEGEADKGNPHVLNKINSSDDEHKKWLEGQKKKISQAKRVISGHKEVLEKIKMLEDEKKELESVVLVHERKIGKIHKEIKDTDEVLETMGDTFSSEDYQHYKKKNEERLNEMHKMMDDVTYRGNQSRIREISGKIKELSGEENEKYKQAVKEYEQAVDDVINNSPCSNRVKKYREIEERSRQDRRELELLNGRIEKEKQDVEKYSKLVQKAKEWGDKDTLEFMETALNLHRDVLEGCEQEKEPIEKRVKQYDEEIKGIGDTDSDDFKEVYNLSVERDTVQNGPYDKLKTEVDWMEIRFPTEYNNPHKMMEVPSESEIVRKLGGGDKTSGSCVSLAYAYIANKAGYDVIDYRGGNSREFFAINSSDIIDKLGAYMEEGTDAVDSAITVMHKNIKEGKEYILSVGNHEAVVRLDNGNLQYLELQSENANGWKTLDQGALRYRFKAGWMGGNIARLVEAEKLSGEKEFIQMMGYLNTAIDKQQKGEGGREK